MKVSEIREMSRDEMLKKVDELGQELLNLRFQQEINQLENTSRLDQTKKDVARIKTILNEKIRKGE
jgi:large subunit ribosomal protein L29